MSGSGKFETHLMETVSRTLYGAVEAGATVSSGVQLTVYGVVSGPVVLDSDARLMVYGTFVPTKIDNRGLILVGGLTDIEDLAAAGKFVLFAGTLLTGGTVPVQLEADGTLRRLPADGGKVDVNTDPSRAFYWSPADDRFVALDAESDGVDAD